MSSFIVKPETINRIVTFLDAETRHNGMYGHAYERILKENNIDMDKDDACQELANRLYSLNVDAVEQRYGKTPKTAWPKGSYHYLHSDLIQVYKSLRCLIYQVSEGDIPTRPIYKMLEELDKAMSYEIIDKMPEFQKAEWD